MKHLVRSIKYFFYFTFLTVIIISALVLTGMADGNIETMFRGGYSALWKIALFFALVAAFYPKVGFIRRSIVSDKDWNEIKGAVISYMNGHSFELEDESKDMMTFRHKGALSRLSRMYEDRITVCRTPEGLEMEGLRKDVFRMSAGLEYSLRPGSED